MTSPRIDSKTKNGNVSRVAMVTGVGGAMGEAIARALLAEGHRVVVADANRAALDAATTGMGDAAFPIVFDLSDAAQIKSACEQVRERVGAVDILVNNA